MKTCRNYFIALAIADRLSVVSLTATNVLWLNGTSQGVGDTVG